MPEVPRPPGPSRVMDDVEENARALDARVRLPRRNTNWGQRAGGTGGRGKHKHPKSFTQTKDAPTGGESAAQTRTSNHKDRRKASLRQGRRVPNNNHCCKCTPKWHREGREGGPKSSISSPESCIVYGSTSSTSSPSHAFPFPSVTHSVEVHRT